MSPEARKHYPVRHPDDGPSQQELGGLESPDFSGLSDSQLRNLGRLGVGGRAVEAEIGRRAAGRHGEEMGLTGDFTRGERDQKWLDGLRKQQEAQVYAGLIDEGHLPHEAAAIILARRTKRGRPADAS